ncbi:MAG: polyprenyl synthetase family protein [Armatimonadota bacterium]|nr:polyprenyl synthetase family protein [Armatimonadota bacterium]
MSISSARAESSLPRLKLFAPIEDDLQKVEKRLADKLISSVETAYAASNHILRAGGKRIRPALVLLSARACADKPPSDRLVDVAASAELVHMATLLHDDVIDGAESRRGRTTANSLWGNQASVLTGDYMLSKAFSLLTQSASPKILRAVAEAAVRMCEGEIRQIELQKHLVPSIDSYLAMIQDKTAAFMSMCCRIGALCVSAPSKAEAALAAYGKNLGLAFQITDDLLDLVGNPKLTGKPIGGDIREGKATLPIILVLLKASQADRTSICRIIASDSVSVEDIEFVRRVAESTGVLEEARSIAGKFVADAIENLGKLPDSPASISLKELAEYVLSRDR